MNDEQWKQYIKTVKDPVRMLAIIVKNNSYFGYDPYYADLRKAILDQALKIVEAQSDD